MESGVLRGKELGGVRKSEKRRLGKKKKVEERMTGAHWPRQRRAGSANV